MQKNNVRNEEPLLGEPPKSRAVTSIIIPVPGPNLNVRLSETLGNHQESHQASSTVHGHQAASAMSSIYDPCVFVSPYPACSFSLAYVGNVVLAALVAITPNKL